MMAARDGALYADVAICGSPNDENCDVDSSTVVDTRTDPANCGQEGYVCQIEEAPADLCVDGSCKVSCHDSLPCGRYNGDRLICGELGYCVPLRESKYGADCPTQHDAFGYSLAAEGDFVVAGAPWKTQRLADGVDEMGEAAQVIYPHIGTVHVLDRTTGVWTRSEMLAPSDHASEARFGVAVDINAIQPFIAVGASGLDRDAIDGGDDLEAADAGAVYVFRPMGGRWIQAAALTDHFAGNDAKFGSSVSIDGVRLAVGAPGELSTRIPAPDTPSGVVYIYEYQQPRQGQEIWVRKTWVKSRREPPTPGDLFGAKVQLEGDELLVGSPGRDWADPLAGDAEGMLTDAGSVHAFKLGEVDNDGNEFWDETQVLKAEADDGAVSFVEAGAKFGAALALDGRYLVVGAYAEDVNGVEDAGAVHVFRKDERDWVYQQRLTARHPHRHAAFGNAVAIKNETILVGSPSDPGDAMSTPSAPNDFEERVMPFQGHLHGAGAVHVFSLGEEGWRETGFVKTREAADPDGFGNSVAVLASGEIVSGAYYEGDVGHTPQCNDNDSHSGAVYIFEIIDEL